MSELELLLLDNDTMHRAEINALRTMCIARIAEYTRNEVVLGVLKESITEELELLDSSINTATARYIAADSRIRREHSNG